MSMYDKLFFFLTMYNATLYKYNLIIFLLNEKFPVIEQALFVCI